MSKHINKGIGRTHYDGDDCCPKPQANTVDEIERMFDGHTYEVEIDGKTMTVVALYSAVNITKNKIQALITEARVDGRKDAIGCSSVIEQEWRAYRGSSSYLEVALETINQTQLKENK